MGLNRYSSFPFRNGKVARNRVVVPPMASGTSDAEGFATPTTIEHYRRLSRSGAGIVFVEYSYVDISGKGEPNQLAVDHDNKIAGLAQIADVIHSHGGLAGLQIVHVGGKGEIETTKQTHLIGPSAISVPVKDWIPDVPRAFLSTEIEHHIELYVSAAGRAVAAGFDIVELHAAHGYGLNQWLSPITNQRADSFGGSRANRVRILLEIVRRIRNRYPQILVAARIPGQDHFLGGLEPGEMALNVADLENAGLDLIDVSSGIGGWRRPDGRNGEGYLVEDASKIRKSTHLPVIGVGGIKTGEYIDGAVGAGLIDFAAVGRRILESPENFREENLTQIGATLARFA